MTAVGLLLSKKDQEVAVEKWMWDSCKRPLKFYAIERRSCVYVEKGPHGEVCCWVEFAVKSDNHFTLWRGTCSISLPPI
jgi:hypothetical protein